MIAKLKGLLESYGTDWLICDVSGVGYLVFASGRTLSNLPRTGEPIALIIETHVREDHIHLYGFANTAERDMFRLLTSVSGVGAKVGLAILSAFDPDTLANAIAAADKTAIARAQGVGPRLAQRIASELKDKVAGIALGSASLPQSAAGADGDATAGVDGAGAGSPAPSEMTDAVSALVNLGYGRADAYGAVAAAAKDLGENTSLQSLIRAGLKELGR